MWKKFLKWCGCSANKKAKTDPQKYADNSFEELSKQDGADEFNNGFYSRIYDFEPRDEYQLRDEKSGDDAKNTKAYTGTNRHLTDCNIKGGPLEWIIKEKEENPLCLAREKAIVPVYYRSDSAWDVKGGYDSGSSTDDADNTLRRSNADTLG